LSGLDRIARGQGGGVLGGSHLDVAGHRDERGDVDRAEHRMIERANLSMNACDARSGAPRATSCAIASGLAARPLVIIAVVSSTNCNATGVPETWPVTVSPLNRTDVPAGG